MEANASFGYWLRRRRRALDLTQEELAQRVGCVAGTIKSIEADARRPSKQLAERLADSLELTSEARAAFLKAARAEVAADRLVVSREPVLLTLTDRTAVDDDAAIGIVTPISPPKLTASLPMGTVTFLFTDIAGSTQLWEQHRQAMRAALARHDAILREAIATQEGVVFRTVGDAFCAAFARATDALTAALATQRALRAEPWRATGPLRVRMALHTGVVERGGDDYLGLPLSRVARLLAAGHGGQVLLSLATAQLVREHLPPDVDLRDLGIHRLKDLSHPEQIFQLVAPNLPAGFPPLRTSTPRPSSLPLSSTPFIGRATELAEITVLLDDAACRLLTLVGPGGTGKTRLALELAARKSAAYPSGVCFVDLAPLSSADTLASTIADALKLTAFGVVDPRAALLNYLREKTLLLLLDNFEHVLPGAELVRELLAEAPGVTILVTSRERLALRAERVYEVCGLSLPDRASQRDFEAFDAVQLFLACVRQAQPHFTLGEAEKPAVLRICQLACGMPLGIELSAAWARMLPAEAIAVEIESSVDFLATTMRDVPVRHRSMRAVFEHSWDLLTEEERAAFQRLSVFRGGFTRQAAEQVAGAALGTLARLLDKSLLRADASGRYSVHELLRQFAAEQLHADSETETYIYERHSAFFLEFLQHKESELKSRRQLAALAEIEREFENVRSAWNWALERGRWERLRQSIATLHFFMEVRSRHKEAIALFQRLVDAFGMAESGAEEMGQSAGLAAFALTMQSWFYIRLGQYEQHRSCLERSHAAVRQFGRPYEIAFHNRLYAFCCSDAEESQVLFEESLAIFRAIGASWDLAFVINGMGHFAFGRGRPLEARRCYEQALALWREIGEAEGVSVALLGLSRVAYTLCDYEEGRWRVQETLALQQALGSKVLVVDCLGLLGEIACAQGQFEEAEAHFRQQLAVARDLGYRELQSSSFTRLGAAILAQGRYGDAAELLREGLALAESCGDPGGIAFAHNQLGKLALGQGARDAARRHWRTALDMTRRVHGRQQLVITDALMGLATLLVEDALMGLAILLAEEGDVKRAIELLTLVRRAAIIDRRIEVRVEHLLADLEPCLPPGQFAAAQARGRALELEATLLDILAESKS